MTLEEYLQQEISIRKGVHYHDGIWWKTTSFGCCQPVYPLQEIVPENARPKRTKSFVRYSYVIPRESIGNHRRARLLLQGERLNGYSPSILDRKRRQAINRASRSGFKTAKIDSLSEYRRDLHEIYISNARRNKHGLPEQWYIEHEDQWWHNLTRENALNGRDWFGVFHGNKLVAFLYACLVDDTALWLVTKSNAEYLISDPNDLLWFDVIEHYQRVASCNRIDAGWAIPVPPSIDWRKRSMGFEPVELPIFDKLARFPIAVIRVSLLMAKPFLKLSAHGTHRGLLFQARTIQKLLDDLSIGN